jgi:hypothetical protein
LRYPDEGFAPVTILAAHGLNIEGIREILIRRRFARNRVLERRLADARQSTERYRQLPEKQ